MGLFGSKDKKEEFNINSLLIENEKIENENNLLSYGHLYITNKRVIVNYFDKVDVFTTIPYKNVDSFILEKGNLSNSYHIIKIITKNNIIEMKFQITTDVIEIYKLLSNKLL